MFGNVSNILNIILYKNFDNLSFEELFNNNIIPIGIIIKEQKIFYENKETLEDILPCIIYKENYKA